MRWKKPERRPETYWKPWFAWRPIALEDTGEWLWLEWTWRHIERRSGINGHTFTQRRYRSDMHWGAANLDALDWPRAS